MDVTVKLNDGKITTTVYSKPTDSHLYLDYASCHPPHVVKNIPKGQFLRLRRICSTTQDFIVNAKSYIQHFINRGYNKEDVEKAARDAMKTSQDDLLKRCEENTKSVDDQSIFVTTYHPKLNRLSSLLKKHFHFISNDEKLSNIFNNAPIVAFRKMRSVSNYVIRSDIRQRESQPSSTYPCKKKSCRTTCHLINSAASITNSSTKRSTKTVNSSCHSKNIVYAVRCKKHDLLYIGHTGDELSSRMSKHRYDFNSRPLNNELTKHLRESPHDFEKDIEVCVIKKDITNAKERELMEDKFICLLGTLQPNGLNASLHQYGEDMYAAYRAVFPKK